MASKLIHVEGLSELKDALDELPKATATNVIKRTLNKAADPIQQAAERMAPRLSGQLQRSITISPKLSRRQAAMRQKESKVEVFVGPGALVQAVTQEFGTIEHPPQPFMRPAWSSNWRRALEIIKDELAVEIEKARQRLARKAARLLKGG